MAGHEVLGASRASVKEELPRTFIVDLEQAARIGFSGEILTLSFEEYSARVARQAPRDLVSRLAELPHAE